MYDMESETYLQKMQMIAKDTKLLNKLMGHDHDSEDDFPYKDFIYKFPWPTNMEIDIRMNPLNVDRVFLT